MRSCTTLAGPAIRRFPGLCSTPLTIRQGHRGSYIAVPATSIALSHNSEKRWLPGVVCGATRAKPSTSWFAAWGPKPACVVEGHSSTETKERSARTPSSEDESDARFRHFLSKAQLDDAGANDVVVCGDPAVAFHASCATSRNANAMVDRCSWESLDLRFASHPPDPVR